MWHQPWDGLLIKGWSQQPNLPIRRPFPPTASPIPRQRVRSIRSALEQLSADLDRIAGDRPVVISSEHLCHTKPVNVAALARVFSGHDVRIVYYLRRLDELIESSYRQSQIGKPGRFPDPKTFIEKSQKAFDFERLIAPWEEAFGAENLYVRLYHRQTCATDIVADFEHTIGLKPTPEHLRLSERTNRSLGPTMTRVLQLFDEHYPNAPKRAAFVDGLRALSQIESGATLVPESLIQQVIDQNADANARVAARYLTDAEATLFLA